MRGLLFSAVIAMTIPAMGQTKQFYIVPVNADGSVTTEGNDYTDKIALAPKENGNFSGNDIAIENGFYFCASSSGGNSLYTIPTWAVNNPVFGYPNPLSICTLSSPYIKVDKGTYDIEFIDRNNTPTGYHMFTITPSDVTQPVYPEHLFIVWGSEAGQYIEVEGKDGVYTATLTTADPFVISYEPSFQEKAFFFGPVSDHNETLDQGVKTPVAFDAGTDYGFTFDPEANPDCRIVINLSAKQPYITIEKKTPTAVDDIAADNTATTSVYTLGGMRLQQSPSELPQGIYIVKEGNATHKLIVR